MAVKETEPLAPLMVTFWLVGEKVALLVMLDSYNLNRTSRARLRRLRAAHLVQNWWFHAANLFSIRMGDRWDFLREKLDIAESRFRIRLAAAYDKFRFPAGSTTQKQLMLRRVNDRAAVEYVPQRYGGRMVVMRCKSHFWKLNDPSLGWGDIAQDGLEVHALPIYPKGILVEPFVRILAEDLKLCIDNAQIDPPIAPHCSAAVGSLDATGAGLHQPRLQAGQGPVVNSPRKHQATPKVPQVVDDETQAQPHFIRS